MAAHIVRDSSVLQAPIGARAPAHRMTDWWRISPGGPLSIALQLEPTLTLPAVEYRWDSDTRILSAALTAHEGAERAPARGANGSVEVEGEDGSWLTLDLDDGCVRGVQVAVWPPVRRRAQLSPPRPPARAGRARLKLPAGTSADVVLSLEVTAPLRAEADPAETNFHFVLGRKRAAVSVAIAADILLELDERDHLSGLWLLNVPPTPTSA